MKKTRNIITVLLLLAMLCSLLGAMAVNASADTNGTGVAQASPVQVTVPVVTKHRVTQGSMMPAETYTFDITPADALDAKDIAISGYTPVIGPAPSAVSNNTIAFTASNESSDATCTPKFTVNLGDKPGIFKYQLKERAGSVSGETYDTGTVYYIYVYYGYASDSATAPSVLAVYAYKKGTNYTLGQAHGTSGNAANNKVNPEFTNTFGTTSLKINKVVTGNMGDRTKNFTFNITFTFDSTTYPSGITGTVKKNGTVIAASQTFQSGAAVSYTLKHNENIEITGLPVGVSYAVSEVEENQDGYVTSVQVVSGNATSARDGGYIGTIVSGNQELTYTNRNNNTPTGVFMTYAPYIAILIAVLALGVVLVVLKKRSKKTVEEDED